MITFSELERTVEEAVVVYFKVLSLYSSGETEEKYDKPQS
jgi:hypothetical protein